MRNVIRQPYKYHTILPYVTVDEKISDLANNNFIKHLPLNVRDSATFHLVSRNSNCCSDLLHLETRFS